MTATSRQLHPPSSRSVSELCLTTLAGHAPFGLFLTDPEGACVYTNERWRELAGLTESESRGWGWIWAVHPQDRPDVVQEWCRCTDDHRPFAREFRFQKPDGSVAWVRAQGFALTDGTGILGYVGIITDMTGYKFAMGALLVDEQRFAAAVRGSSDGIWDWDPRTNYCYFSPRWKELFGFQDHELAHRIESFYELVHPDDLEYVMNAARVHLEERTPFQLEIRGRHKSGAYRWFRVRGEASWDETGLPTRMAGSLTDITEQKLDADALKQSEARFRALADLAPEGILVCGDSGILYINRVGLSLLRGSTSEILGRPVQDFLHPEFHKTAIQHITTTPGRHSSTPRNKVQMIRLDGTIMEAEFSAASITWNGQAAFLLHLTDISVRQQLEREKDKAEDRFRLLTTHAPVGLVLSDPQGSCLYVNERWCELSGLPAEQARGRGWLKALHPEDRPRVATEWSEFVRNPDGFTSEYRFLRPDETVRRVKVTAFSIRNASGDVTGLIRSVMDVTEQHQTEQALKNALHHLQTAQALAHLGSWKWEIDSRAEQWSDEQFRIFGYAPGSVTPDRDLFLTAVHPEDLSRILAAVDAALYEHAPYDVECRIIRPNGEIRYIRCKGETERDTSGRPTRMTGTVHDLTEEKRAEEERARLDAHLRHAHKMEAIGRLAGGIAHEFNNSLTAILGFSELALRTIPSTEKAHAQIQQVIEAARRSRDLVGQILTFSRQTEEKKQAISFHLLTKETLRLLRLALPKNIELRENIDSHTTPVLADALQIYQVLVNLCANAEQAMQATGGVLEIRLENVEVSADKDICLKGFAPGPSVRLTVCDTGHGMEPGVKDRLFEPFFTTKRIGQGLGMGLAVVHGIVENHAGVIEVSSRKGEGTCIEIYLPALQDHETRKIG